MDMNVTVDMGLKDKEGYVWLVGRAEDVGSYRIYESFVPAKIYYLKIKTARPKIFMQIKVQSK